ARIGNRQGTQHYGMDQGENCRGPPNPQGQRKHGRYGEYRREPELPYNITKIAEQFLHCRPHALLEEYVRNRKMVPGLSDSLRCHEALGRNTRRLIYHWILRPDTSFMVSLKDIQNARSLLHNIAVRTPLVLCKLPNEPQMQMNDRQIYIKPENLQPVGSFKLRGAYNKISSLTPEERKRGVVAHSSGNHAQGVAFAARALGVKATIVMPATAPKVKLDATRAMGAELV